MLSCYYLPAPLVAGLTPAMLIIDLLSVSTLVSISFEASAH